MTERPYHHGMLNGLPLHPAAVHFPIAALFFAAGALLMAQLRGSERGRVWLDGATLLLSVAILTLPGAAITGRLWADSKGFVPNGEIIPTAEYLEGNLRRHVQLAIVGVVLTGTALWASQRARRGGPVVLALILAGLAAAVIGYVGHLGGTMAFGG